MFVITLLTLRTKLHCTHNIILVLLSFEDITYNIIDYRAVEMLQIVSEFMEQIREKKFNLHLKY